MLELTKIFFDCPRQRRSCGYFRALDHLPGLVRSPDISIQNVLGTTVEPRYGELFSINRLFTK